MKYLVAVLALAFASMSMASPKIDINHHNSSVKGAVKSNIHNKNSNYNGNKNANYNGNKNNNSNSNSNYNKASNYSNNKASGSNYNHTSTNADSKSKANSKSGAYNGGNSVNVEGDNYDLPANTAATSIGGVCTDSGAVQGNNFGLSMGRANPVCEKLKMYEIYKNAGMEEEAAASLRDAESLADTRGFFRGFLTVITLGIL